MQLLQLFTSWIKHVGITCLKICTLYSFLVAFQVRGLLCPFDMIQEFLQNGSFGFCLASHLVSLFKKACSRLVISVPGSQGLDSEGVFFKVVAFTMQVGICNSQLAGCLNSWCWALLPPSGIQTNWQAACCASLPQNPR